MIFALLLALAAHATPSALECSAVFRSLDDKNNTVEHSQGLVVKPYGSDQLLHSLRFQGRELRVTEEKNGDLFAQILSPKSTGFVSRGAPDSQGRFTATEVLGFTVVRLECSRH